MILFPVLRQRSVDVGRRKHDFSVCGEEKVLRDSTRKLGVGEDPVSCERVIPAVAHCVRSNYSPAAFAACGSAGGEWMESCACFCISGRHAAPASR
jgi:hypothetical protein